MTGWINRREAMAASWALPGALAWPRAGAADPLQRETRVLFGAPAELVVVAARALDLAPVWAGLAWMNRRWNAWKPQGLAPLNQALREGRWVQVTPALRALIRGAAELELRSGGHFNAGIGGLVQAWGFHDDTLRPGARPGPAQIDRWRAASPGLQQLQWRGLQLRSPSPRLQLDFGGYAKGVAADWALDRLQAAGAQAAIANLGGNLATWGRPQARAWQVGIRDPEGSGLLAQLAAAGREAVVTSGSYERFRLLDGEACCHLIDPTSAQPVRELVSATVAHVDAGVADAAASALMVAGARRWPAVAAAMGLDQVLVVHRSGLAEVTPRLAARLQPMPHWRAALRVI